MHTFLVCCIIITLSLFHDISSSRLSSSSTDLISGLSSLPSQLNQYEGDGDSYWRSLSDFKPIEATSYGTITIKNSFYMKFNLIWHGLSTNVAHANRPYEGIFRLGFPSTNVADCNGHATRYPALYFDKKTGGIQFSISDHIDCWGVGLLNVSYNHLQINTLYTFTIQFNNTWVIIQANNKILCNKKRPGHTHDTMLYKSAAVMFSDSLDPAANMTLSNIIIISYDNTLTMPPTSSPTIQPTISPTTVPTITTTELETTDMIETIGDADTFSVQVVIYIVYDDNDGTLNATILTSVIIDIFPTNTSVIEININTEDNGIYVNTETEINKKENVNILIAYLKNNLTMDLVNNIPQVNIIEVKYEITIKEIYINDSNDMDIDNNNSILSFLPIDDNDIMYIVIGAVLLCFCLFILCVCMLYRYCSLKCKVNRNTCVINNNNNHHKVQTVSIDMIDIDDGHDHDNNNNRIKQELQRLSQSLSANNSGSVEEVSLGTHVMSGKTSCVSEGIEKMNSFYHRVQTNVEPMDEDDSDIDDDLQLDALTTENFSDKVNMNLNDSNNLDVLIKDQIRVTNRYNDEEVDDDNFVSIDGSLTHSSHEAMYDEGFSDIQFTGDTSTNTIYVSAHSHSK